MTDEADAMVLDALRRHHGTIIIDNPSRALLAVGKENTDLHEEMDRCHRELDVFREALTVAAYLSPELTGGVDAAFTKLQTLARAALQQIALGPRDRALLDVINRRLRSAADGRQQ